MAEQKFKGVNIMNTTQATRADIKSRAKESLKGKYWQAVGVSLLVSVIAGASSGIASALQASENSVMSIIGFVLTWAVMLLVAIPISLGITRYFIKLAKGENAQVDDLFSIYKDGLGNAILTVLLEGIYIMLWSLLFLVPGIIKSYSYLMIEYMVAENPNMDRKRAFEITKATMAGDKWKAFVLGLSFIGWILLCGITFGIGFIFLSPYISATMSHYYLDLKDKAVANGIATAEEFNA